MVYKNFFAPNSPTFWVKQAENREHMQLQSVTRFTQKQYIVGPYYADLNGVIFCAMALKGPA